jgi:catechol 2,3-dioxygenase-like lactoylglutathione lyase family enzyme
MTIGRVYETVLYGRPVHELARFYRETLALRQVAEFASAVAFRLPDGGVLLLFDPELQERPERTIPSHGARGPGHAAFSVGRGELERWAGALRDHGIELEHAQAWDEAGGRSIYFRDPVGNSIELIEGEAWPP